MPSTSPDPAEQVDVSGYQPRRVARVAVEGSSKLRPQHLYSVEIRVRDVSTCGFMAECAEPVKIGSYVSLDVPGVGPVHAQVRWQVGPRMGGKFLDPISLGRCEWVAVKTDVRAA